MKTINMICKRCSGVMRLEAGRISSSLVCPYCGNNVQMLVESDRVKIAAMRADAAREKAVYRAAMESQNRKAQIWAICITAAAVLALILVYISQVSG